ncbi:MAG: hypothetical protein AAF750_09950 [Planctomycetota bacterium]
MPYPRPATLLALLLTLSTTACVIAEPTTIPRVAGGPKGPVSSEPLPRWNDRVFGVSVQPPLNSEPLPTSATVLAAWLAPGPVRYQLSILRSQGQLSLKQSMVSAMNEVSHAFQRPRADGKPFFGRIAGQRFTRAYYWIADRGLKDNRPLRAEHPEDWDIYFGHALVQIAPTALLVLQAEGPALQHEQVRNGLQALLESLQLEPADTVAQRTRDAVQAGIVWRDGIFPEDLADAFNEPRAFRVIRDNRDVGYITLNPTQLTPEDLAIGGPGLAVRVQSRLVLNDNETVDRLATYYHSNDRETELWSIRTTLRGVLPPRPGQAVQQPRKRTASWSETGTRSDRLPANTPGNDPRFGTKAFNRIVVSREGAPPQQILDFVKRRGPGRVKLFRDDQDPDLMPVRIQDAVKAQGEVSHQVWPTPNPDTKAYLSQTELLALARFLPTDTREEFAFYAYDFDRAKVALHWVSVLPQPDKSSRVEVRAHPNAAPRTFVYNPQGQLTAIQRPHGFTVQPTTPQELQAIWQ